MTNTDVYNMSEVLLDLQKNMMEETDEEALAVGTYGFFNAAISKMIVDSVRIAADNSNEVFPTRAKYDKNILTHAMNNEITDVNAIPATIPIQLCLLQENLDSLLDLRGGSVTISTECAFYLGDYEYHFDYPIVITKQEIEGHKFVYTARYDGVEEYKNDLSDIVNPFLPSPYIFKMNSRNYIFIIARLRQVERIVETQKILTNNIIDNKTYLFSFENQLAGFEVYVNMASSQDGKPIKLTPVFEGSIIPHGTNYYCWYTYLDEDTIRVKFDADSYMPSINDDIQTIIYTTHGEECNFTFMENIIATLEDTENNTYNNLEYMIIAQGDSAGGKNKMSMDDLKALLPKQAQSRGNIINSKDIQNYFSSLSTKDVKIQPIIKVDNQIMRVYYLYLLMRDDENMIVPTNTLDVLFDVTKADTINNIVGTTHQYVYNQGCYIGYSAETGAKVLKINPEDPESEEEGYDKLSDYEFIYTLPYKTVITDEGPMVSYFMDTVDKKYETFYEYIGTGTPVQFICQYMHFVRNIEDDHYELRFDLIQNIEEDFNIVTVDEETGEETVNIKLIALAEDDTATIQRFFIGDYLGKDDTNGIGYKFKIDFRTSGAMTANNYVRMINCYQIGTDISQPVIVPEVWDCPYDLKLHIYAIVKFDNISAGNNGLGEYVKGIEGYSCTNVYTTSKNELISLYENYTEISSSVVDPTRSHYVGPEEGYFTVKSVPLLRRSYAMDQTKLSKFLNKLNEFRDYIYKALDILEGGFKIDFKYYNTYGPSFLYTANSAKDLRLNRVNISLDFDLYLKKISDDYTRNYIIRDILNMVEDLNSEPDRHITNIVAEILNKYSNSIYYISFRGLNSDCKDDEGKCIYDANNQHLYCKEELDIGDIPEFININRLDDGTPDINITLTS